MSGVKTCALCGQPILAKPSDADDRGPDEHTPPLQFFPKKLRAALRNGLWKVPSHRRCNASYKLDEEYFVHALYPLIPCHNEKMGQVMLDELKRRAAKPQSRTLIRRVLRGCDQRSAGGIWLPPGLRRVSLEGSRIRRVGVKVSRCLFYLDNGRNIPESCCVFTQFCKEPGALREPFDMLWRVKECERRSAAPEVFRYWYCEDQGLHSYAMFYWEAFMFCVMFREPARANTPDDD